jgi:predicted RNA-binding Zn-ribbon protein involved in translation (DUF1610 family)
VSTAQVHATALLCRLLELTKPQVNGAALLGGEFGEGGVELIHERLLTLGTPLNYVTCSDCGIEMARVVNQILMYCDECGEVQTGRELQQTYTVSLSRLVDRLAASLQLPAASAKVIDHEFSWRLGVQEPQRGKAQTWYFARHLDDHAVATRLRDQIKNDQALRSCKIITSTAVPLPGGSPLADFTLMNLASIARLSQSRFEFFSGRMADHVAVSDVDTPFQTTLRLVRTEGKARVDSIDYELEPRQKYLLLALMEDFDHEMDRDALRTACRSQADPFSPSKVFERNQVVYKQFIKYQSGDGVYALQIPEEDRDWLN